MGFTRISNASLNSRGATTLPNQPQISAAALKQEFDAPAKNVVAPAVNNLMDELEASTGGGNIGAVAPTGRTGTTVQGVINSVSSDLATLEANAGTAIADAHTHSNKALLDTYTQSETDLASAVADDHTHSNKSLLDTYTQTEANISDAVSKKHEHSNKALLDTYSQSESDLADAVSKKHSHTNKALLDTYTQTNTDIADAVSSKHTHSNKTVLDKFGESGGNPTYDGNPIGGGGSGDAYKTIEAAGTSFVASGADTFKINAGSNVTITALTGDKGIQISATGGGQSTGDMLMSQYDNDSSVKNASSTGNGIKDFVASEIGKLDVSDSAVSGQYVSAVSETDGKISVSRASLPAVPTKVSDLTNDSGYQTASDVATAISGKEDKSALKDLAYIDIDGSSSTKVLQGDGTWVTPSTGGHTMIPNNTAISSLATKSQDPTDDDVASGYAISNWSNTDSITLLTAVDQGDDTIGTWTDTWETDGVRSYWLKHKALFKVWNDDEVEVEPLFHIEQGSNNAVGMYAYRLDDELYEAVTSPTGNPQEQGWYESDGQTPPTYTLTTDTTVVSGKTYYVGIGAMAFKLSGAVQTSGAYVGVKLIRIRTKLEYITRTA